MESGSGYKHSAEYGYDNLNNLNWLTETINGVKHTTNYTYDEDNRLTGTTYVDLANGEDVSETIVYDDYGRIRTINVKNNGAGGSHPGSSMPTPTSAVMKPPVRFTCIRSVLPETLFTAITNMMPTAISQAISCMAKTR